MTSKTSAASAACADMVLPGNVALPSWIRLQLLLSVSVMVFVTVTRTFRNVLLMVTTVVGLVQQEILETHSEYDGCLCKNFGDVVLESDEDGRLFQL